MKPGFELLLCAYDAQIRGEGLVTHRWLTDREQSVDRLNLAQSLLRVHAERPEGDRGVLLYARGSNAASASGASGVSKWGLRGERGERRVRGEQGERGERRVRGRVS